MNKSSLFLAMSLLNPYSKDAFNIGLSTIDNRVQSTCHVCGKPSSSKVCSSHCEDIYLKKIPNDIKLDDK